MKKSTMKKRVIRFMFNWFLPMKINRSNNSCICNECSNTLEGFGFICFDLVSQICADFMDSITSAYQENQKTTTLSTVISFLERKNFLVTTDIEDSYIEIRPNTIFGNYDESRG